MMDSIEAHNSRWKVRAVAAEEAQHNTISPWSRVDWRIVLAALVTVLIPLLLRASKPAVSYECPPASLSLPEIREVQENGSIYLTGTAVNKTGRDVRKAVFQVKYDKTVPATCIYLTLQKVGRGARYGFRVPIPRLRTLPTDRVVVPFSIQWQ